ncbi:hypothetical protein RJ641_005478 [Dillenia turbinata]|uniref:Uncharacterized protein n=1 Tax=Dillenia turbinata TaxID=194707 RepID=A0AAN8V6G2_9MAGN
MSWWRSAVNKAAEVGNKNNLSRTVRNYADSVGQAVAEGAKLFQDRISPRNVKSFRQTVNRLEDAAVSCRGPDRAELLRRWLVALKENEKMSGSIVEDKEKKPDQLSVPEEQKDFKRKPSFVLYYDSDMGGRPRNFRDVFLHSQALEGVILSMILEAPNEEEVSLLLEMFGFCLTGGKEVHNAIVSSIQDLATAFACYQDEVLVKRDELLQFAQGAISGLKISADLGSIEAEAYSLKKKLENLDVPSEASQGHEDDSEETALATIEALKQALARIRVCSRLEGLLIKKKSLNSGDSPEIHAQKVDKLKVLSESLASSTAKAEKRITDHRFQKEEALKFRVTKASEVGEVEKEIETEIAVLEKERDELEAQLKKVNDTLAAVRARLHNTWEERDQFYEANNQIVEHLKMKEDELSKSISSCKVEADVLKTWINFLEDTWTLQCSHTEIKDKQVNDELERHEDYFVNVAIDLLSSYKKKLGPSISCIGKYVENLNTLTNRSEEANEDVGVLNPRKNLEEEYLDYEAKIITTFSVVDNMKEQFYSLQGKTRKNDAKVKELFDDIEKLRQQFEAIERPTLEMENPTPGAETSSNENVQRSSSDPTAPKSLELEKNGPQISSHPTTTKTIEVEKNVPIEAAPDKVDQVLDTEAELAKLETEFGKVSQDYTYEEIGDWEFDELEKELRAVKGGVLDAATLLLLSNQLNLHTPAKSCNYLI